MSNNANWKEKISFLSPTFIEREISGQNVKFYALSPRLLFELKGLARPITSALTVLFADKSGDQGKAMKDFTSPASQHMDASGDLVHIPEERGQQTDILATSAEIVQLRSDLKERAIDKIIDAMSNDNNMRALAKLIFNSCREIFPRNPKDEDLNHFIETADIGHFYDFLVGVAKANAKVFGPLGEKVSEAFAKKVSGLETENDDQDESENETSSAQTSSPTPLETNPQPMPTGIPHPMTPTPNPG